MKKQINKKSLVIYLDIILIFTGFNILRAQPLTPDSRYKVDILIVVAHPDDETAIGGKLAKWVFDDGKKIAVVYTNRGQGGGNSIGQEQYYAMGAIREIEARRALSSFGIDKVWFLDGIDTPGQDVLHSLQNLPHGAALEKLMRYVRLTRPEIIVTWLPAFVAGENHGDHQAAGVIATEAFDMAGDPTIFPAQVAFPRETMDINNFYEGLRPWQVKKIYYFSDRDEIINAPGPRFDIKAKSPSQGKTYIELAAQLHKFHQTQADVAQIAEQAEQSGNWQPMIEWLEKFQLIYGKSVVKCDPSGDVFDGVSEEPAEFHKNTGYVSQISKGIKLRFGGIFDYYRNFWQAHDLQHLANLVPPEIAIAVGSYFHVPLLITNGAKKTIKLSVKPILQAGWQEVSGSGEYVVPAGESLPIQCFYFAPEKKTDGFQHLKWQINQDGKVLDEIVMNVKLVEWALPQ
ncbi:MAG TPA: PIG-L family deacetylase [Candidatus Marinimicrobia bacterium]|nr:PIG-L family deacetylase [Candidatus Neomarinimicrobiota bacterium]HRS51222.1 PIG-L family deacetylase [Candidatus Neomarinimicrobiota bacterium]HRU91540.1 PIG-L family deacetylase [Candidatus Neomarinimicrobiota bacterium]